MRSAVLLLLASAAIVTCGRDVDAPEPRGRTISPATFADVVAELAVARIETEPDTAAFAARREVVLDRHGVTREDLWAFARDRGEDDDVMIRVYTRVGARLDSLFGERTSDRFPQPPDTVRGTPDGIADTVPSE